MAMNRREMEFFVARGLHDLDNEALAKIARQVLGKEITLRGSRFSFPRKQAQETNQMADTTTPPVGAQAKLSTAQVNALLDVLKGEDRFNDNYAPAKKLVELSLANWKGNAGLSADRLILTEEGKARAELERAKRDGK
ncbi:hypothetical protein [Rhizobium sp. BK176]|uniref:hypothetical protein n=1 Tax=Rhizobium sp. BK176 TaxID=2587071 RepID=UPI0021686636|nr:hypothetical protein [Rhizobium sp. BK176]MCS4088692.1 hypothetical protein [Rhizobium sp. BK176]